MKTLLLFLLLVLNSFCCSAQTVQQSYYVGKTRSWIIDELSRFKQIKVTVEYKPGRLPWRCGSFYSTPRSGERMQESAVDNYWVIQYTRPYITSNGKQCSITHEYTFLDTKADNDTCIAYTISIRGKNANIFAQGYKRQLDEPLGKSEINIQPFASDYDERLGYYWRDRNQNSIWRLEKVSKKGWHVLPRKYIFFGPTIERRKKYLFFGQIDYIEKKYLLFGKIGNDEPLVTESTFFRDSRSYFWRLSARQIPSPPPPRSE